MKSSSNAGGASSANYGGNSGSFNSGGAGSRSGSSKKISSLKSYAE